MTESNESPIVSFRVPREVIAKLQATGRLGDTYTKSELSNLIKNDWLASVGTDVKSPVSVNDMFEKVDSVHNEVQSVHKRLDEISQQLKELRQKRVA